MANIVYQYKCYAIKQCRRNYKVYWKGDEENYHGHGKDFEKCVNLIGMMVNGKVPKDPFWREFARRASKPGKYKELVERKIEKDRDKDHYININKGIQI